MNREKDRVKVRMPFFEAWRKYKANEELDPLEKQLIEIILQHPEYHSILDKPGEYLEHDYGPMGDNPFLHMGLHLNLIEQISSDRPQGIRDIYQSLTKKKGSTLEAEHMMMDCLINNMMKAQQIGKMSTDEEYLGQLKQLLK
jgi:hypothetical protein